MQKKVLLTAAIDPGGINLLTAHGYEVVNEEGATIDNVAARIGECAGVITRTQHIDEDVLLSGKRLQVVAKHGVGVDCINVQAATERGIQVVNAPESNSESVVEHSIAFYLSLYKNTLQCHRAVASGRYLDRDQLKLFQIKGKTLGIVGYGRIGSHIAEKMLAAFDVTVCVYDPYVVTENLPAKLKKVDTLDQLLACSDIVSLHLPLTEQTHHLFSEDEFGKMKRSAYFVNMARGPVVDERALIEALKSGEIAGAAVDVFEQEPPAPSNELFGLDNVILSPHNAALTKEAKELMSLHAAQGVIEVLEGKQPTWPVNNIS